MNFLYPVPPNSIVTQSFAQHERRREENGWTNYNGGIDWFVPSGTMIRAAQKGTVAAVRTDATGYGTHVRIEHVDGDTKYSTIYAHLMNSKVPVGGKVEAGDIIGVSDNTGFSNGPHLHFELRKGTTPIDPSPLLVRTLEELAGGGNGAVTREAPADMGTAPLEFPRLPRARVLVATLNVRTAPGVENLIAGTLIMGDRVEVLRKIVQGENIWLQIGHQQFVAMCHDGVVLAQWI